MVRQIVGDLFDFVGEGVICHQVNCKGVMGTGVAEQVKNNYPDVFQEYQSHCRRHPIEKLKGTCLLSRTPSGYLVANLFGQVSYGRNVCHTDLDLLRTAFLDLFSKCDEDEVIFVPYMIGAELGGGKVIDVFRLLLEISNEHNRQIVVVKRQA